MDKPNSSADRADSQEGNGNAPRVIDGRGHDYFVVDNPVVDQLVEKIDAKRRADALAVYTILCRRADNKTGETTVKLSYLTSKTGRSKPIIIEALKALRKLDLIGIETRRANGRQLASTYTLNRVSRVKPDNSVPDVQSQNIENTGLRGFTASTEDSLLLEDSATNVAPDTSGSSKKKDDEEPKGWEFEEYIRDELDAKSLAYTRGVVRRYTRQANTLLGKGVEPEAIYEACDRVVSEWQRIRLSLDDAMRDVENGYGPGVAGAGNAAMNNVTNLNPPKPPASRTPEEVVTWCVINARSDWFRGNETRIRQAMNRHDFTSGEHPPYPVQKLIGGTDNEIWQALDSIHSLIRRYERERDEGSARG